MAQGEQENILEVQQMVSSYYPRLVQSAEQIAVLVRSGKWDDAMALMIPHMEGVQWLKTVFEHLQELKVVSVKDELVQLSEILAELIEALDRQDMVLIADLYEYEISSLVLQLGESPFKG